MDEVTQLQSLIKQRLLATGLSQAALAEKIFVEDHDDNDDAALARFTATLKKQLNRPSTSAAKLRRYLEILLADRRGLEGRYPAIASAQLPKALREPLQQLSAEIDGLLQHK